MIRVLVIDDSVSFLTAATEVILAAKGFVLAGVAQTGSEGIELARISRPDLALIDLRMPGLGGTETAARLAKESPETRLVLMTAAPAVNRPATEVFDKRKLSPAALAEIWNHARTSCPA